MPRVDREAQNAYNRRHYRKNRQYYVDKAARRRQGIYAEVAAIKEAAGCADCRGRFPHYVLDFDHVGDDAKVADVATLIRDGNRRAIASEIDKCEVVCANCHRVRTWVRNHPPA